LHRAAAATAQHRATARNTAMSTSPGPLPQCTIQMAITRLSISVNTTRGWAGEVECTRGRRGRVSYRSRRATTSRAGGHPQAQAYAPHVNNSYRPLPLHPIPSPATTPALHTAPVPHHTQTAAPAAAEHPEIARPRPTARVRTIRGYVWAATGYVEPAATAPAPAFPAPETGPAAPVATGAGIAVCGAGVYVPTTSGAARARARPKSKRECKMRMGRTEIQRRRT
jgi:hypothetical protein